MSVLGGNPLLIAGDDGYQISRSVRLRSSASAYFNRTLTTPTDSKKFTFSDWIKRGSLGAAQFILQAGDTSNQEAQWYFQSDNTIRFYQYTGSYQYDYTSVQVFRDPSAWYHIVVAYDSTQATAANRFKVYINGSEITLTRTVDVSLNATNSKVNAAVGHDIGGSNIEARWFDGYLTEVNFIDGQALTPSSFGETDTTTGVWKPKRYAGTYGTNGFYLNFSDNSAATAAAIGKDSSGNGNNWTPNNISVTSGVTYDSMLDVPTMGGAGSNHCVMNPLDKDTNLTLSDGNLTVTGYNAGGSASFGLTSGKWYWEVTLVNDYAANNWGLHGVSSGKPNSYISGYTGYPTGAGVWANTSGGSGGTWASGSLVSGSTTWANGDVLGLAFDAANLTLDVYRNNVKIGTTLTVPSGAIYPTAYQNGTSGDTSSSAYNFGQRPFAHTPPTGFKALNTQNLPDATIKKGNDYFDAKTYTGNGSTQSITGMDFSPDLIWQKDRTSTQYHVLTDILTSYLPKSTRAASGGSLATTYNLTISSNTQNYSVYNQAVAAGYDGEGLCTVNVTVNSGVVVGSSSSYLPALDFRGFPTGCSLNLTVSATAYIVGAGGNGGRGGYSWGSNGAAGDAGGDAIWASSALSVTNNGTIAGGGGGGGGGGGSAPTGGYGTPGGNGGGGAGNAVGIGAGPLTATAGYTSAKAGDGTLTTGGSGTGSPAQSGGQGGSGGALGSAGTAGATGQTAWNGTVAYGAAGGAAGLYADGNSFITWVVAGTRLGGVSSSVSKYGSFYLSSNATNASAGLANGLGYINADGFSFGSASSINANSDAYAAWAWKAGGFAVSNTNGSITSSVSAGATQGFSVVTYTSTTGTVGHGLGVAPAMIIMKGLNVSDQWTVGHKSINGGTNPWNYGLALNATSAQDANSGFWNNTAPTSTVFSQGSWDSGYTKVAYCFAEVAGFSKFGSYTGNGSADGPFVYLGFRPKWIMTKRTDSTGNWLVVDSSRNTYNVVNGYLLPNASDAEGSATWGDFTSNGFKLRGTTHNGSGETYIYAAFAENPFKNSLAR